MGKGIISKKINLLTLVMVCALTAAFVLQGCSSKEGKTEGEEQIQEQEQASTEEKPTVAVDVQDEEEQPSNQEEQPSNQEEQSPVQEDEAITEVTEDVPPVEPQVDNTQQIRPYAGKKVTICGDSISTFTGYIPENYSKFYPESGDITDVNHTWWMQVIQNTGMELCRNASYSGSTVSGQSQDNYDGRFSCGNQRIADLASTQGDWPEVIIILMGANDLLNDIPLGAYDGVSAVPEGNIETFSEAYALMLDKMKTWYPDAEIFCCTIAEVSRWNDAGEKFPFRNAHGLVATDYNNWIKAIANAKGVEVIDVYSCGITYENAQENTSDGTHPNVAGAKLIADKVSAYFNQ